MMEILKLQRYYNEILLLQQHSIYNVLNRHCKVSAIFKKPSNSFINILAILPDFNEIYSKYSLNITVLGGDLIVSHIEQRNILG